MLFDVEVFKNENCRPPHRFTLITWSCFNFFFFSSEELQDNSGSEDEGDTKLLEVRFIPADPQSLDSMYKAMSDCQILHPDPQEEPLSDGMLILSCRRGSSLFEISSLPDLVSFMSCLFH